jgi:hypothetical protein
MSEADPDKVPTGILLQCADEKPLPLFFSFLSRSKKVPSIYSNWVIFSKCTSWFLKTQQTPLSKHTMPIINPNPGSYLIVH